jgi:sn-glycerol 3-phosphate transport system permease protein
VQWPLLMPTTLFVLVNAVINAFRMVDHIVRADARRARQRVDAAAVPAVRGGLQFWDTGYAAAMTVVLLAWCWPRWRCSSSSCSTSGCITSERHRHAPGLQRARLARCAGGVAGCWRCCGCCRWATRCGPRSTRPSSRPLRPDSPLTLDNFAPRLGAAPFARYFLNTTALVLMILAAQLVLARSRPMLSRASSSAASSVAFALVLVQLMVMPDILIVENYKTMARLGLVDTLLAIGLPYFASAFAIFLLRQTFKGIPKELDDAARVEGASALQVLWRVYVPLAKPVYTAFALVSVSFHWNNFLWPLVITNSVEARPLTVGLQVFSSVDQGIDWSIITAATLMTSAPLLIAFLLFQRQFVQSFMRAGIK